MGGALWALNTHHTLDTSQATSVLSPLLDAEVHVGREGEVSLQARTVASGEVALFGDEVQGKGGYKLLSL